MKKLSRLVSIIFLTLVISASFANASIYTISNGDIVNQQIDSLSFAMSAINYQNYNGYGQAGFLPQTDVGYLYLYQNLNKGTISLGIILDSINSGTAGSASMLFTGAPLTSFLEYSNDPGELFQTGNGIYTGNWIWGDKWNDGGLIGGLAVPPALDWTITVSLLSSTGINSWYFLTGDAMNPSKIFLDMSQDLIISDPSNNVPVPEPSTFLLLGSGLLGLGFLARKRRK